MKEVCRETGLTDKAVRVYIQNELIHPQYTENYAGRKNFDFGTYDVALLQRIALLRKYGFSLGDIKALLEGEDIGEILDTHIITVSQNAAETSFVLTNLQHASDSAPQTLDALCAVLQHQVQPREADLVSQINTLWGKVKKRIPLLITTVLVGIVLSVGVIIGLIIALSKLLLLLP